MPTDMKYLFLLLGSITLISGQFYKPMCPSDQTVTVGCPTGWYSYESDCFLLNTTKSVYIDARSSCNLLGARLLRIADRKQHEFIINLLNLNAIDRSVQWFTAGISDPASLGKFIWDGYADEQKKFNEELMSLFLDRVNLNDRNAWDLLRTKVAYVYQGIGWSFNATKEDTPSYFVCQVSKSMADKLVNPTRGPDFGQDGINVLRGPCITSQPTDQFFLPAITNTKTVTFTCGVYGNPNPTVSWYFTRDVSEGVQERTLIDPLKFPSGMVSQTGGMLTMINPGPSLDNKIECQASNVFGHVISRPVQIVRGRLELYNKNERQKKVIADNTGFLLDCEAPDHSPEDSLVYTFYITRKNDKGLVIDDIIQSQLRNNLFLSTNLGLIGFSIASNKDSGTYKCMVGWKGVSGTSYKSPDIPLTVIASNTIYPPPMVNDKFPNFRPSNPFLGDVVEFECFGYGMIKQNPLKYLWTWNGGKLPVKAKISDFDRRVRLDSVQFEDQGTYGCSIVTYDGLVSAVRTVDLRISARPTFTSRPGNLYPDVGSTVSLSGQAVGQPAVSTRWFRNDVPLSTWLAGAVPAVRARYNVTEGPVGTATLSITAVAATDNAMFGCVAWNTFGRESVFVELRVVSMVPNFSKYPLLNQEAIAGSNTVIACRPEGSPSPAVEWRFNGATLALTPTFFNQATGQIDCGGSTCSLPNNNLFLKAVAGASQGMYTCVATNQLGAASSSAYLAVVSPLVINNMPVGRRVQVNTNVYLPCQASGTPYLDIDYDWYFEDVRIKFDRMDLDARRYDRSQFWRPYYRYFGTLTIANIQFYDEGNYTCRITTPFSSISVPALIQVVGPPGVGGGITIGASAATANVTNLVEWTDGNNHGKPVLWYKLEVVKEDGLLRWYTLVDRINRTQVNVVKRQENLERNQYVFSGLPANTNFRLRISAANEYGLGEPSGPSEVFKTEAIAPVKAPQNVTGGGGKVGTLVIRWEPLTALEENGDRFIYEIQYREEREIEWIALSNPLNKSLDDGRYRQVTVDLAPNKDYIPYRVRVRASNAVGPGPWSDEATITSASKLPSLAPQNVRAGSFNGTAIQVEWQAPLVGPGEGPIQGYHIVYWLRLSDCKSQQASRDRLRSSQRLTLYGPTLASGIIIGLASDNYYCIGVQMFNTAGDSLESSFVDQTTFKKPPQNFPTVMRLNSTNTPHQIQVSWNGVRVNPEEESVDGYRMRYWLSGAPVRTATDVDVGLKVTGLINNLQYEVRYNLRIFAYSRGGHGKLSNPMDQFMLVPRDRCLHNQIIDGPDVRYVFVCRGCMQSASLVLLVCSWLLVRLVRAL